MEHGVIFDLVRYAIHDGPGIRTTVFFKGCPLSCRWCQNPEGLDPAPEKVPGFHRPKFNPLFSNGTSSLNTVGHDVSVRALMAEIVKDKPFFARSGGGVTVSGGEPLMQPLFLKALLEACRRARIRTALDTSGYAPWPVLDTIRHLVDLFLYDIKIVDEARHVRYTGVSNLAILDNLRRLARKKARIWVRFPVIPGVTDRAGDIRALGGLIASLRPIESISILPYNYLSPDKYRRMHKKFPFPGMAPPSDRRLRSLKKRLSSHGVALVRIAG